MHGIEHAAQMAGMSLVSGIWQGLLLAAATGLCLRLAPKTPAAVRYGIWSAVLLLIAALPLVESQWAAGPAAAGSPMLRLDVRWSFAIAAVWAAVSLYRAAGLVMQGIGLWRLRRRATPIAVNDEIAGLLASGPRRVALCSSSEIERPSVAGFFRPAILIPDWLHAQMSPDELAQVVLHEMEHLRRGDDWLNLLQKLSLTLLPLNPIVAWIERRLCYERELACDDGVLRRTQAPRAYATCLTSLAERGLDRRRLSLTLGMAGGALRQSELARRVHRILRRETTLSPWRTRALTGAVTLGLLGGAAELARCPQIVSFAAPTMAASTAPANLPDPASRLGDRVTDRINAMPAQAIAASYNEAAPARMTLATATLQKTSTPAKPKHKVHKPVAAAPKPAPPANEKIAADKPAEPAPQRWVVLTAMPMTDRPQMILPVVDSDNHLLPYAAVPTADGWLLVQL